MLSETALIFGKAFCLQKGLNWLLCSEDKKSFLNVLNAIISGNIAQTLYDKHRKLFK